MTGEQVKRRLAAVLAADVAGYSRLMGANEEGTLARLKTVRKALIDPNIAFHRGRIVKTTGDGMLVEFASAVDAVCSAVEIQRNMAEQNIAVPPAERIEFRIGIHVGDIIIDDNDIFGDGVNIAARLESIADTGGVSISRAVHDQVRDRVNAVFHDCGDVSLKNIARPIQVFKLRDFGQDSVSSPPGSRPPFAIPDKPSIVVLPFQNMSGDPEQEYFADGMVEDITTALSRNSALFVIARNSSFAYKGKAIDIRKVGIELGVRYVLEGSVRKMGGRLRITGQLIDASTNTYLWADRFDGGLDDVFELQDKITTSVILEISPRIEHAEIAKSKQRVGNLQAYDYYLRGLSAFYKFNAQGSEEARPLFEKALSLDPNSAMAYTGLAAVYLFSKVWLLIDFNDQELFKIEKLTYDFLSILKDDARVLAHAGQVVGLLLQRKEEGQALLKRSVIIDQNFATSRIWLGTVSLFLGELDFAQENYQWALRLSPLEPRIFLAYSGLACCSFFAGEYERALEWATAAMRHSPRYPPGPRIAMACYAMLGQIPEAKTALHTALELDPSLTISNFQKRSSFHRTEHLKKFEDAYRIAGLPE